MSHPRVYDPMLGRRAFLSLGGASLAGVVLAGCGDDDEPTATQSPPPATTEEKADLTLDFSDPLTVVNYAYALEQLEAAFYEQARNNPFPGATKEEVSVLDSLKGHEFAHREFFKTALGDKAIPALEPEFSAIDFMDRKSVLETASVFENLGVAAYNGAAALIDLEGPLGAVPLMAAGDIVSVEARHASTINDLIGKSFAPTAFDQALSPSEVLEAAQPFIKTRIAVTNVPS